MATLKNGDFVNVKRGGGVIRRRVVATTDNTIYICKDEEYVDARTAGRDPVSVGFPLTCIVEDPERPPT
jgi:hypothetical protein